MEPEVLDAEILRLVKNAWKLSNEFLTESDLRRFISVEHCQTVHDHEMKKALVRLEKSGKIMFYGSGSDKTVLFLKL